MNTHMLYIRFTGSSLDSCFSELMADEKSADTIFIRQTHRIKKRISSIRLHWFVF